MGRCLRHARFWSSRSHGEPLDSVDRIGAITYYSKTVSE
jgi:hypothetical protein